jgi:hypothetical protein
MIQSSSQVDAIDKPADLAERINANGVTKQTRSFQENPQLRSAFEIHTVDATNLGAGT